MLFLEYMHVLHMPWSIPLFLILDTLSMVCTEVLQSTILSNWPKILNVQQEGSTYGKFTLTWMYPLEEHFMQSKKVCI